MPLRSPFRRAYTLVELFVTIAVLIIILGVMVDLANEVRRNSADRLTRQLLRQLSALMQDYVDHNDGQLPPIAPLLPPRTVGRAAGTWGAGGIGGAGGAEADLQQAAARNNGEFIRLLRGQFTLAQTAPPLNRPHAQQDVFAGLPLSLYDQRTLHDPWGSPIVFMPHQDPRVGMAPADHFFFFSAGPDRKFLTRQDNLYSYDQPPVPLP